MSLNALSDLPGYVYLGSPYSKYALGHDVAAYVVGRAAARLMARGVRVYCPIVHGHSVSQYGRLPNTWEFWKDQCQPMIDGAAALVVLMMDGWDASVGLLYEIDCFTAARKPVIYVDPRELAGLEGVA